MLYLQWYCWSIRSVANSCGSGLDFREGMLCSRICRMRLEKCRCSEKRLDKLRTLFTVLGRLKYLSLKGLEEEEMGSLKTFTYVKGRCSNI